MSKLDKRREMSSGSRPKGSGKAQILRVCCAKRQVRRDDSQRIQTLYFVIILGLAQTGKALSFQFSVNNSINTFDILLSKRITLSGSKWGFIFSKIFFGLSKNKMFSCFIPALIAPFSTSLK